MVICNETHAQTANCTPPELVAKNLTATVSAKTVGISIPEEVNSISTTVTNIIENIAFNDTEKAKEVNSYLIHTAQKMKFSIKDFFIFCIVTVTLITRPDRDKKDERVNIIPRLYREKRLG